MSELKQTLTSMEVADMVKKEHKMLLRDLRRYINQFNQCKLAPVDFFQEGTYEDAKGETRPCYRITKKGCEFIAHKLTGTKGTIFTARYINRFHEMQDILSKQEPELPWFIRKFQGNYIMLFRDFKELTGVEFSGNYTARERPDRLRGGWDYNGWGWYTNINKEEFKKEYGFDYGDDSCMMYLYQRGIPKALEMLKSDKKAKAVPGSYDLIKNAVDMIQKPKEISVKKEQTSLVISKNTNSDIPVQINIVLKDGTMNYLQQ